MENNNDIIKINNDTKLTDDNGKPIQINVPKPEYITETFGRRRNDSQVIACEGEQ